MNAGRGPVVAGEDLAAGPRRVALIAQRLPLVRGGADGVGKATTNTVYAAAIGILVSDFFITKLFMAF